MLHSQECTYYVDETEYEVEADFQSPMVSKTSNSLEALNDTVIANLYHRNPVHVFVNQSWDAALPILHRGK